MKVFQDVFVRRVIRHVYGTKRQGQEERTISVVPLDQLDRLVGQQKSRIAGLDHGAAVPMPIQDDAAAKCEGIDSRRIEAVVMIESAL